MIVRRISCKRLAFMSSETMELELPSSGLILVSGRNGSGKTGFFIDSTAIALYGETIRGSSPWKEGKGKETHGTARLEVEGVPGLGWIDRSNFGAKLTHESTPEFTTVTKAENALEALIPPFKIWRRCSVFSGDDAAIFSAASDSERKNLLETILGLEKFDTALAACRTDLSSGENLLTTRQNELSKIEALLNREKKALESAYELASCNELPTVPDVSSTRAKSDSLKIELEKVSVEMRQNKEFVEHARTKASHAEAALVQSRRSLDRFANGKCPTCGQDVKESLKAAREECDKAESATKDAKTTLQGLQEKRLLVERLEAKRKGIVQEIAECDAEVRSADKLKKSQEETVKMRTKAEKEIARIEDSVSELESQKSLIETDIQNSTREVAELKATESVLGLRGVRSAVLSKALDGLEAVTNSYLSTLSPDIRIEIKPYTERKSGNAVEAISIHVQGAGGGHGYKACSTGQKRRIDLALLLALSAIGEGALGSKSDLFFDEAFDGLDKDGVSALGELLVEIAQHRKVIVISHNPDLLETLKPRATLKFHVDNGVITPC